MAKYLIFRLLDAIPTVFLVLLLVFIAMRILPGDPAIAALGDMATTEQLQMFRERMGLNDPLWLQFVTFVKGVLTLDLDTSMMSNQPVTALIAYNLPYTIELTIVAMLMGTLAGVPLGVWAATNRNKWPDATVRGLSLTGYAVPDFYLGALLLITFALNLGWFPISGGGEGFSDRLYHVFLPALTLAFVKTAFVGRLTRTSLLEVLSKALLPLTTGLGLSLLATLSGSVAIELVFNRPGIGKLLISAIAERDYPVIQGGVVVFAMFVVVINLLMDLLYIVVDPRIRVK
jgi:ABC-type dipeptide/oligopeptide/nickel transport system permease component